MAILYDNFVGGLVSDDPLTAGATTINSAGLANLSTVVGSDRMWLVLDPDSVAGAPEIVKVTAHTAAATSATVIRGQQGTTAREHLLNTEWIQSFTAEDADALPTSVLTTAGDLVVGTGSNNVIRQPVGADGLSLVADSSLSNKVKWGHEQQALAKVSQNAQVFTHGVTETFSWDAPTATFDPLGWWAAGNPTRVTPDVAGLYAVFSWSAMVSALTTITLRIVAVAKNGTVVTDSTMQSPGSATSLDHPLHSFTLVELNGTTDFLELQSRHNDSGGTNRQHQGTMTVKLVRPT